jgi:predicted acylesterase/phospholipase RssA
VTRVLVLGGGGSRGAFQAGWLRAQSGVFDAIHGVSVGAINGARVAQYASAEPAARQLEMDWLNTSTATVLAQWPVGTLSALVEGSLYSTEPLAALLRRRLAERALLHPCVVYAASLATGGLARFALTGDVTRDVPAILASAAFPTVMPPVPIDDDLYYDGGVVRVVPLPEALVAHVGVDEIDVVLCADPYEPLPLTTPEKGLRALLRTVDVATHDRARTDLLEARADWDAMPLRPRVRLWWPREQHCEDPMNFDPKHTERAMRQGFEDARRGPQEVWT